MRCNRKSLAILLCLFLMSFKVAVANIFIDAAIERAQMHQMAHISDLSDGGKSAIHGSNGERESHTLFLMSHVTANVGETGVVIAFVPHQIATFIPSKNILYTQNFPDSAFKPPKITA